MKPSVLDVYRSDGGFFLAAFEFKHHPFDVPVILVAAQELQALLRIAPFQNFDRLRRAPQLFISRWFAM